MSAGEPDIADTRSAASPSDQALDILWLTRRPAQLEAAVRALAESGLPARAVVVDSPGDLEPALARGGFHLILADSDLAGQGGAEAAAILERLGCALPLILLAGRPGEEAAAGRLLAAAADCVFEDDPPRLAAAVRRALQRHRADSARIQTLAEARFRDLIEALPDAVLEIDAEGRILSANRAAETIFGYRPEELLGQQIEILIPPRFRRPHRLCHAAELRLPPDRLFHAPLDPRALRKDGTEIPVEIDLTRLESERGPRFACLVRDLTERRLLEEQLRQAQKMETLGRLAAGVAHDFNNLLTVIGGFSQMALDALSPRHPARKDLDLIREAARRAASLTRQLLTFSRRQPLKPRVVDLNRIVTRLDKMLRRLIGEDIQLRLVLAPAPLRVRADPTRLSQLLLNLAVNARDAMPQGGSLSVRTERMEFSPADAAPPGPAPGTYAVLSVTDTGVGMDEHVRSRLFEPFFTTKPKGQGAGLGLSTVYGIVKQSGGEIRVQSRPGAGATFQILLPLASQTPAAAELRVASRKPRQGTETILLVEDEDAVRRLAAAMLRRQGYTVLEAADGLEALKLWETHGRQIRLLATDVVMPRMGGRELAGRLRRLRPDLPVLFVSGYTDQILSRYGVSGSQGGFLQKPFDQAELTRKIRALLESPGGP